MKSPVSKQDHHSVTKEFLLFLSIPMGVILILTAVLQGPSLFAKPKYDFIYSLCQDYNCSGVYTVGPDGQLIYNGADNNLSAATTEPTVYYYRESLHAAKPIQLTQADIYKLDSSNVSPDGYTLWQNNGSDNGFLFWGGSGDGNWYLKDGAKKKQLNISTDYSNGNQVRFIGWVQQ